MFWQKKHTISRALHHGRFVRFGPRRKITCTVKKNVRGFPSPPQPGCHLLNSPWPGRDIPGRDGTSLAGTGHPWPGRDIPAGDGKTANLFYNVFHFYPWIPDVAYLKLSVPVRKAGYTPCYSPDHEVSNTHHTYFCQTVHALRPRGFQIEVRVTRSK